MSLECKFCSKLTKTGLYRLAAKLRLLQQRTGLVLLDVWNVIEAFRENGLANTTADIDMTISKVVCPQLQNCYKI